MLRVRGQPRPQCVSCLTGLQSEILPQKQNSHTNPEKWNKRKELLLACIVEKWAELRRSMREGWQPGVNVSRLLSPRCVDGAWKVLGRCRGSQSKAGVWQRSLSPSMPPSGL